MVDTSRRGAIQTVIEQPEWATQSGTRPRTRRTCARDRWRACPRSRSSSSSHAATRPCRTRRRRRSSAPARSRTGRRSSGTTSRSRPIRRFPKNPHTFLTRIPGLADRPVAAAVALAAQDQIAQFFASGGTTVDRSGRRGAALRDADERAAAGGPGLHPVAIGFQRARAAGTARGGAEQQPAARPRLARGAGGRARRRTR